MSLLSDFELGLWNGWILVFPLLLIFLFGQIVSKEKFEDPPLTEKERKLYYIYIVTLISSFIYPIFLPLKLGTVWFYVGFIIYLVGVLSAVVAEFNFATAPANTLLTEGVYSISRHPMYLGAFLTFIGVNMACTSWIFLLAPMIFITVGNVFVVSEERFCLKKYGDAYREYMNRTPRWIGIPKSRKKMKG
jgi:protein-S-isoprenylcysteine O-methyltransferase Ste14